MFIEKANICDKTNELKQLLILKNWRSMLQFCSLLQIPFVLLTGASLFYFDHTCILYYNDFQKHNYPEIDKASLKFTQGKLGWQFDKVLFIDHHCEL